MPAALLVLAAAAAVRPAIARGRRRTLDAALLACLLCPLLQLLPIPQAAREALSPSAGAVDQALRFDTVRAARGLSINAAATADAAVLTALVLLAFWSTREALREGGSRAIARPIAWAGLAVSVIAIVVRASGTTMIYGFWGTGYATPPYGPFINRNHMGTWLVMALPLVVGYIFARADLASRERQGAAAIDAVMLWLAAAASAMLAAAVVSLSRSTAVGVVTGALAGASMARRRRSRGLRWLVAGAVAAAALIVLSIPRTVELADRFQDSRTTAAWSRPQIWRETVPIVRDFWLTGTGLGTYSTAMLVYQRADRTLFFNQAHNQYLQFAAEGGLLLLLPLLVAAVQFASAVRQRLGEDRTAVFWIRAGAVAGIVGVLVQSIWETGLLMPANAMLFAAICAIAVHDRPRDPSPTDARSSWFGPLDRPTQTARDGRVQALAPDSNCGSTFERICCRDSP